MTAKRIWGRTHPGARRPLGSGKRPSPDSRHNRVAGMVGDAELRQLKKLARAAMTLPADPCPDMMRRE